MVGVDFQSSLVHFSHNHTLELNTWEGGAAGQQCCSGCLKPVGNGLIYRCTLCNYYLHFICADNPLQIHHPAHIHSLSLLSGPCAEGARACKACGQGISFGFYYNCDLCKFDLHPSCANLPTELNHPHHPQHTLALSFIPPYSTRAFTCNVCQEPGDSWHYHCSPCCYDSHVNCIQIPYLRESLLNYISQDIYRAYVNVVEGRMGGSMPTSSAPRHIERPAWDASRFLSCLRPSSQIYQQQPAFQHSYHTVLNLFVKTAIEAFMHEILVNFMLTDPVGGGGGVLDGFSSFGDLSDFIGSIFGYGFF